MSDIEYDEARERVRRMAAGASDLARRQELAAASSARTGAGSAVHIIALVKGAVEGDPHAHFGSLLGFEAHLAAAQCLGLLGADGQPTKDGLALYYDGGLRSLPGGRANEWSATAPEALALAVRMLEDWRRG